MITKCIFFDLADTLYSSSEFENKLKRAPIDFIIYKSNVSREEALLLLNNSENRAREKDILLTKTNILIEAGFINADWQNFIAEFDAKKYLEPINENIDTLHYLGKRYKLGIITNNNTKFLKKILEALGLENTLFSYFITSDDTPESKPNLAPFLIAIQKVNSAPEEIIYIGDNIKKDMEPAKKVGMKTILMDYKNVYTDVNNQAYDYRIQKIQELKEIL